jgi:hypothetical protein
VAPEVAENIPEHVLGDNHLKVPGPHDQDRRRGIHVEGLRLHGRKIAGNLREDLPRGILGTQHLFLITLSGKRDENRA